ncbi:histidine-rich glycoprotein isoform X1 [Cebus imitator]|uniref:Histidine-rich glycoprotein n=1 Tax=Cebus imitator TaxID=2715852 RepID=A0A2K5PIA1_CEBIM|nr:histidine-rich glycoprotein isoform X1 [Cebus imitator]
MKAFIAALLLITLQYSCAVSPTDCNAIEPEAEKALDLINKRRRDGYLFQLLRVADAHLDRVETATIYYLALDVQESNCWVLSRKHGNDCEPAGSRRPSDMVIGQCKVIAIRHSHESQDLRVIDFNCTTSSVSSALANTKDSPVLLDFFEDTEPYRKQADKALEKYKEENDDFASFRVDQIERVARERGGKGTGYYVDFSVRNCSRNHFPRHPNVFGFCRADLFYDVEALDLESPKDLVVNCEVFDPQEHGNIRGVPPHLGCPFQWGGHEHSLPTKSPFKPHRSRDQHHPHKPHEHGCPPPPDEKDHSDRPPLQQGDPLVPKSCSRCHHATFGMNRTQRHPHNHNSSDLQSHGHRPHAHHPHEHGTHRQHPHGHHPHVHHPHQNGTHRQHPHGHHPHGQHPHGHHPHGHHPHYHDFQDYGPCDPPPHSQGHHHHGHGPPPGHLRRLGPCKGHCPFHSRQTGSVYRLPPLRKGEVLPLPEANFPSFPLPPHNHPPKPDIQPFPQSPSESCPGKFKSKFPQVSEFFAHTVPK